MYKILIYWASKGIDGFRCDMVEMVPVEFWAWAIPRVRRDYPKLLFVAEIYNPAAYTDYLFRGHFDYLYDKVGLYDTLRGVVAGARSASDITHCWQSLPSIGQRMLNFLENHDEQRIASDFFASDPRHALPALVVSACMSTNPFMLYMGQELGERGMDSEGFSGRDGRTTIFDYWALDTLRRWRNGGRYDGGRLTTDERALQSYYRRVLTLCNAEPALQQGMFYDLMYVNHGNWRFNDHRQFAFIRKHDRTALLIVANFDYSPRDSRHQPAGTCVQLPWHPPAGAGPLRRPPHQHPGGHQLHTLPSHHGVPSRVWLRHAPGRLLTPVPCVWMRNGLASRRHRCVWQARCGAIYIMCVSRGCQSLTSS